MVAARRLNEQAGALVRQGRLAVYPSSHGQEACQVAAARSAGRGRLAVPDLPRLGGHRRPRGRPGRGADDAARRLALRLRPDRPPRRAAGHPAGDPAAARRRASGTPPGCEGEDTVVMALCGDGATSEGDFHEALNFAAVFAAPVVFLVQNNKYAISVPLARQSVAPSLAAKGVGYGVPAVLVDGNDLAALTVMLAAAVQRARDGRRADAGRGRHLPRSRRTPTPTTPPGTAPTTRSSRGCAAIRCVRLRAYLTGRGLLDEAAEAADPPPRRRRWPARRANRAERRGRRSTRVSCSPTSTPRPPRSWPSRRRCCAPS